MICNKFPENKNTAHFKRLFCSCYRTELKTNMTHKKKKRCLNLQLPLSSAWLAAEEATLPATSPGLFSAATRNRISHIISFLQCHTTPETQILHVLKQKCEVTQRNGRIFYNQGCTKYSYFYLHLTEKWNNLSIHTGDKVQIFTHTFFQELAKYITIRDLLLCSSTSDIQLSYIVVPVIYTLAIQQYQ